MKKGCVGLLLCLSLITTGCGGTKQAAESDVVRVLRTTPQAGAIVLTTQDAEAKSSGENVVDLMSEDGLRNFVESRYPHQRFQTVRVVRQNGATSDHTITGDATPVRTNPPLQAAATPPASTAATSADGLPIPPTGCQIDPNITPVAGINDSQSAKANAVMSVATSKMGIPYVWGHNEDRGQDGFDCSNFTAYVYHHALGYIMSSSSQTQNTSIGVPVPADQMKVGDLLIFENGAHVGIYAGNNQVIQEGGGLKKVGYLDISPGTYWSNNLTAVKRMF